MQVNTFLLAVPVAKKDDYVRIAAPFAEIGDMLFGGDRMIPGGFEPILSYRKD